LRATVTGTLEETYSEAVAALPRGLGVLGRYVLLEMIGQGGMGVVWKAYDPVLDRQLALKLLVASPETGSVISEAQAMARVQHPNVVAVYDAGVHAAGGHELAFVAMELVAGTTLGRWLEDPARTLEEKLDVFALAGRGLDAAHQAGLVHRDFKPSNVLIDDAGRVRVSDFGLSVAVGTTTPAPASASGPTSAPIAGTPRYMSPGQLHGLPPDARSDQFAFCVALYQAVFGEPPFALADDVSTEEMRVRILRTPKPPVRSRLAGRVAPILLRGLSPEPDERWPSMKELLAALGGVRGPGRRRVVAGAAVGVVLVGAALVGWRVLGVADDVCGGATDELAAIWRPERRQALASAFGRLPGGGEAWQRVDGVIANWASRWSVLRVEQCEADRGGERTSPTSIARGACLDRRLDELDALLGALDAPDATVVTYASSAAHGLTLPEGCASVAPPVEGLPPPPVGAGVAEAYAHVDRAAALNRLGKERPALDEAKLGVEAATKLAWAPLVAVAQIQLGRALQRVNETSPALDAFYEGFWAAERARDDELRFDAAMGLASANVLASEYPTAKRWQETAKAIAQHLPADVSREARMTYEAMDLALYDGRMKDCLRLSEDGLRQAEAVGPESPILIRMLVTVSQCARSVEDTRASAAQHLERALPLSEKVHGHDHKTTATILTELGILARRAGRYDDALAHYREALAIRERIVGPDNPDCAGLRNNIANVYRDQRRFDEARAELERALEIWSKTFGPDSPATANGLKNLGRISMEEGRPEVAEPLFRRTLEISRARRPAGHPDIGADAGTLGRCLLAQRKPGAVPLLEESLAALEADEDASEPERAYARFWVGRARVELGIRTDGARAMVTAACAAMDDPSTKDEAAECRAWLAAHP
jgi:tetratricopeptide (TPR) repeat protein